MSQNPPHKKQTNAIPPPHHPSKKAFPLSEFQANAIAYQALHNHEGLVKAAEEPIETLARVQDTHYLGSKQWDYCREMSQLANSYDDATEEYITCNMEVFDFSGKERMACVLGGDDTYRETKIWRKGEAKWGVVGGDGCRSVSASD